MFSVSGPIYGSSNGLNRWDVSKNSEGSSSIYIYNYIDAIRVCDLMCMIQLIFFCQGLRCCQLHPLFLSRRTGIITIPMFLNHSVSVGVWSQSTTKWTSWPCQLGNVEKYGILGFQKLPPTAHLFGLGRQRGPHRALPRLHCRHLPRAEKCGLCTARKLRKCPGPDAR